jgi:3-oxoacyl-[acyl-carrier protein] reductase
MTTSGSSLGPILQDRVAIVTGAGRGLGRAFAVALAQAGAAVVVNSFTEENTAGTVKEIEAAGGRAVGVSGDVGVPGFFDELVATSVDTFGTLDILVNNAGISKPAMVWKMTDEEWDDVLRVNLTSMFYGVRAASRVMMEKAYGRIVNVTSAGGIEGSPGQINYGSSKAGVIGLTKSAAKQLAKYGITVNAVAPVANTPMTEIIRDSPKYLEKTLARIPMGRMAETEEVAPSVVFLCSEAASYTTGMVMLADGGMSM